MLTLARVVCRGRKPSGDQRFAHFLGAQHVIGADDRGELF